MSYLLTESPYIFFRSNALTDELLANLPTIRAEYADHIVRKAPFPKSRVLNHRGQLFANGFLGMVGIMIKGNFLNAAEKATWNWGADESIRWWRDRTVDQPWITNWADRNQAVVAAVTFNHAEPGTVINYHWGLDPDYLRLHLCLTADPLCEFNIEGWIRPWVAGEIFGFDDCNVLHGTRHRGQQTRTILVVDVLKSALQPYSLSWPCRSARPPKEAWPAIELAYTQAWQD